MSINEKQNEIIENFSMLDDWNDKYDYIASLGRKLQPLPENCKNELNQIKGCQSSVWVLATYHKENLVLEGDSDSIVIKGILFLLISVLSNQKAQDIVNAEIYFPEKTGLKSHLSPAIVNGMISIIAQIKHLAKECLKNVSIK